MTDTRSTCPYCGVGCGVIIESADGQVTGVRGDPEHPANFGRLCAKGSTLHLTATVEVRRHERLLQPMWREQRGVPLRPLGWSETMQRLAERFAATIREHGPDSVAFYVSGQLLTEDYYVFNKLAKGLIGTNNIDTNSRLCMSSAVAGYKQSLGSDAPPGCYDDVNHADCLFITGSNAAWTHPVLFRRIEDAKKARPQMKLVVVDPRRTETAMCADLHLQIQPGTDVALLHGMLHAMIWEELVDRAFIEQHTEGYAALKAVVADMPPREAARVCGVPVESVLQAARWFAGESAPALPPVAALQRRAAGPESGAAPGGKWATLSMWCQGLNQSSSGTAKNTALINLHLATGQIGRPGAGPFSLTGQPNAMGGREVGGMANLLSGHRDLSNAADRAEVAKLWGIAAVPATPGKTAVPLFEAMERGEIKALWIACTNPAQSMPDQAMVRRALERCELVVLQEAFANTATARYADVLLPASTWAEKEGTVTNSERCISRVRAAVAPPGEARDDTTIVIDFARRLQPLLKPGTPDLFAYRTIEAVWNEHRESTRGRDLDITGLSYALLESAGPQQWPVPAGTEGRGTVRLYEDRVFATASGRARFIAQPYRVPAEARDARHPFALNTGRMRDQWHGMSRSGVVPKLFGHESGPVLRMNPHDLPRRGLATGDLVEVASKRGGVVLPLVADDAIGRGEAYAAMHWGEEFVSGRSATGARLAGVNALTSRAVCPESFQPELKYAAVRVTKAELPWRMAAAAWLDADQYATARDGLRGLLGEFAYASCVPSAAADGRRGLVFEAASAEPIVAARVDAVAALLGVGGPATLRYADAVRGQRRLIALEGVGAEARIAALVLAGPAPLADWLRTLWQMQGAAAPFGRALLSPGVEAPTGMAPKSRQVCNCFDVSEARIRDCLAHVAGTPAERVIALQHALHCGTQCGSCLPELRRLETEVRMTAVA